MVINDNEDGRVKGLQQTEAAQRRAQASGSGGAIKTNSYPSDPTPTYTWGERKVYLRLAAGLLRLR